MTRTASPKPARHSGTQKITLAILGFLVVGTVFVLPNIVSGPLFFGEDQSAPAPPTAASTTVAPSTAAEKTKYRQDSQGVLARFVAIRDRLSERNVELWADAEFQQGLNRVADGDEQYSFGEYKAALEHYRFGLELFETLEARGNEQLVRAKTETLAAIESLNPVIAASSLELALAMAPDDPVVQALQARAAVLPDVVGRMEAGDDARDDGELQLARQAYQEALALDPQHPAPANALSELATAITDNQFKQHMSRGLAALEAGDYDGAVAAFRAADDVYPGHAAVKQGLAQVENRRSLSIVDQRIRRAAELESREEWQQAQQVYQSLLEEDPSLTQAQVKLIPVKVRADLDARLDEFIEDPLILSSQAGYQRGQAALADARGIPDPGGRLSSQIAELEDLLVAAVSVVNVEFQSDNATHVTLFRVKDLGQFERTSVRLRPGRYVAAGQRAGFRDVRVEFTVTGKPMEAPVIVRCEEPI